MIKNQSLISKHAKSFNWAGFFLSKETFSKCSTLYDFCRSIDDIVDGDEALDVRQKKFKESIPDYMELKHYKSNIADSFIKENMKFFSNLI